MDLFLPKNDPSTLALITQDLLSGFLKNIARSRVQNRCTEKQDCRVRNSDKLFYEGVHLTLSPYIFSV